MIKRDDVVRSQRELGLIPSEYTVRNAIPTKPKVVKQQMSNSVSVKEGSSPQCQKRAVSTPESPNMTGKKFRKV